MTCKYTEHTIVCGVGGFTVTGRTPQVCQRHNWAPFWHMGYIIGRVCVVCGRKRYMSAAWCAEAERIANNPERKP